MPTDGPPRWVGVKPETAAEIQAQAIRDGARQGAENKISPGPLLTERDFGGMYGVWREGRLSLSLCSV
eukprot:scaffold9758_cov29-Tisochrysis_lutea.AAC.4